MEFTLTYRGPLSSNGDADEKQILRRHFHKQLKALWKQPPLRDKNASKPPAHPLYEDSIKKVGPFQFAPLVSNHLSFTASLNITFLRPGFPGQLVNIGGDIDNRMKTLFDSLAIPPENQIPKTDLPQSDENPLFCLLEDDALIDAVTVRTDRLLDSQNVREAMLVIHITTRCHFAYMVSDL